MANVGAGAWREVLDTGQFGRFALLCAGVWLHAADSLITATAVPAIVADVGGVAYVAWTIALYQIGAIVAGTGAAMACDRHGLKRVTMAAALVYGVGCVVAALAPNMPALLAARLVQGIGGGMLLSLSYVAIQQSFPDRLWGRLFGLQAVIWAAGSLLGPLIGGLFVQFGMWRGIFWCFAAQAAVLGLVASVLLQPPVAARCVTTRFPGVRMLLLAMATLLVAQAGVTGSGLAGLALGLSGLLLLYLAARLDRRSTDRLLPVQLLDLRHPVGAGLLAVFALAVATTGFWAYGPLLLAALFGVQPLFSGYILAGEALAWSAATMAIAAAPLAAGRMLIRAGAALVALGSAGLAVVVPAGSLTGIVVCVLLPGVGFGLCWPAIVQRTVRFASEPERTLAAAAPGIVQRVGYAVGAAASGVAANLAGLADGISMAAARAAGFWVFAAFVPLLVVGLVAAWRFTAAADPAD